MLASSREQRGEGEEPRRRPARQQRARENEE
jgi:hypothetical protein